MSSQRIKLWLGKKKKTDGLLAGGTAVLALLAGLFVLFLTFWFSYAIVYMGGYGISALSELVFNHKAILPHGGRLIVCGIFIVLLFLQHLRTNPWHWGDYAEADYKSAPFLQMHTGVEGGIASLLAHPGASANMITDILLSGPRLVCGSYSLWQQAKELRRMDSHDCAELLYWLAAQNAPAPYDELHSAGWEVPLKQLKSIQGVVFLQKGVKLSDELKAELATLKES